MPLLRAALSWNFVLATAICASLLAQLIKVLLNLFIFHRFIAERMWVRAVCPAPTRPPSAPWLSPPGGTAV